MTLIYILASTTLVSLISLIGIFFLGLKDALLKKLINILVALAAGTLLGGAFLHLIPEALEGMKNARLAFLWVIGGFFLFFLMERVLLWRHCHKKKCEVHPFAILNLLGDAVHNFTDGMVMAAAFLSSTALGWSVTLAVAMHEIPQEIGDFGVLVAGKFSKTQALLFNLLSALTCVLGALFIYFISLSVTNLNLYIHLLAAGGFLYIAASDLIPLLHQTKSPRSSLAFSLVMIAGLFIMLSLTWLR